MSFDLKNLTPKENRKEVSGFSAIPSGEYEAVIDSMENTTTIEKTGQYLKTTFQILSGDYANRLIFANINVKNNSAIAESIGLKLLDEIAQALGYSDAIGAENVDNLLNKPLIIDVGQKDNTFNGKTTKQNTVKSASSLSGIKTFVKVEKIPEIQNNDTDNDDVPF